MKTVDYRPRRQWDEQLGLPHGSVEHIVHGSTSWHKVQRGELTLADYWADIAQQLGLSTEQIRQLATDFFAGDELDTDIIGYIKELRADGHAVALLSNESPALAAKLQTLGIHDLFDPLIISAIIGVMKPDPAAFQIVLKALGRTPDETVFIDDMAANIAGATALGMRAIHYRPQLDLRKSLEPLLAIT